MSAGTPKAQAVRYWWSKALESLAAARRDLDAGDEAFAISRAYYALFYEFDEAYVRDQLRGCEAFLREIRPLLASLPPEGEADGRD